MLTLDARDGLVCCGVTRRVKVTTGSAALPVRRAATSPSSIMSKTIFDGVRYYLAPSIAPYVVRTLMNLLDNNGAVQEELSDATHIITNSERFEGWQTIRKDAYVVTVRYNTSIPAPTLSSVLAVLGRAIHGP